MRASFLLAGVVLCLALVPTASAAEELRLVPEWPESFQDARSERIRLLPGPPIEEQARHGPLVPGASSTGTSHSFQWYLENPDGSPGPAGDLELAEAQPILVDVYLSAGAASGPLGSGLPADPPAGAAPNVTVEATLEIGEATYGPERTTHTLVSTPLEEVGDNVTRYELVFEPEESTVPAGAGLGLDVAVYQANASGERATQPLWRIHTGSQHPTGLSLPLDDTEESSGSPLSLQAADDEASTETVQAGAYATLVASLTAAAWAARRGYRELRES